MLASMGAFYVPLGFITVCYVVIFIRLKSKMKRRTDRQKAQNIEMKIRRPNGKRFSKVKKTGPSQTRLIKGSG